MLHICSNVISFSSLIGVQLLYNVVLVSAVQQSESAIHIHISPSFWISFPFRSPQTTEQSSLYYTFCSHQLPILYTVVYICQSQSPNSSHPRFLPLVSVRLFSTCVSLFLLCKYVHLHHSSRFHICVLMYDICFSLSDLLHSKGGSLPDHQSKIAVLSLYPNPTLIHSTYYLLILYIYVYILSVQIRIRTQLHEQRLHLPCSLMHAQH